MKIFLDTSFFVSFLRGEGQAKEIYEKIRSEELYYFLKCSGGDNIYTDET